MSAYTLGEIADRLDGAGMFEYAERLREWNVRLDERTKERDEARETADHWHGVVVSLREGE